MPLIQWQRYNLVEGLKAMPISLACTNELGLRLQDEVPSHVFHAEHVPAIRQDFLGLQKKYPMCKP